MQVTYQMLKSLEAEYGEAFYLLDADRFAANYRALLAAFRAEYKNTAIAYSYKTNYIPALCKAVDALGGYAEVVSHMEYALAKRIGVAPEKIVFNGPYKKPDAVKELLLSGGTVHLDSLQELKLLQTIAEENPHTQLNVGVRVNFPIGDGVVSRFGFEAQGDDFKAVLAFIARYQTINLQALHCHFASRKLETWKPRAVGIMRLLREHHLRPERIDLGGGMFGRMDERLGRQFGGEIPTYQDYARAVGEALRQTLPEDYHPLLMIEPGSALAGDCMDLAAKVQSVKTVQGQAVATVLASTHNIQMGAKIPVVDAFCATEAQERKEGTVHIAGYTCIESDYLMKDFQRLLSAGDYVVFRNIGSYSLVLKPPFILPNVPVLMMDAKRQWTQAKRAETHEDVFQTYFERR